MTTYAHKLNSQYCSCGQDAVTCQVCGELHCGNFASWVNVGILLDNPRMNFMGNVCPACFDKHRKD